MTNTSSLLALCAVLPLLAFAGCGSEGTVKVHVEPNYSEKLRLDGFYYAINEGPYAHSLDVIFLYRNGSLMRVGPVINPDLSRMEEWQNYFEQQSKLRMNSPIARSYRIFEDSIAVDKRWISDGRSGLIETQKGRILNDSTFSLTMEEYPDSDERDFFNIVYHFKKFSPKPDSSNVR